MPSNPRRCVFKSLGPTSAATGGMAARGCSQHTGRRLPHVRHSYWPCEGHIGAVCINLHHRSAICTRVGFIHPPSSPGRAISKIAWRRGVRASTSSARTTMRLPAFRCRKQLAYGTFAAVRFREVYMKRPLWTGWSGLLVQQELHSQMQVMHLRGPSCLYFPYPAVSRAWPMAPLEQLDQPGGPRAYL